MADFILSVFFVLFGLYLIKSIFTPKRNPSNMPLIINRRGGRTIPSRTVPLVPSLASPGKQAEKLASPSSGDYNDNKDNNDAEFNASLQDVVAVKDMVMRAGKLPLELADLILEHAEYWACSSTTVDYTSIAMGHMLIRGGSNNEDQFLIRTEPLAMTSWSPSDDGAWTQPSPPRSLRAEYPPERLQKFVEEPKPRLEHPCRKIVFNIHSNDQGWGGDREDHGTYRKSWTWFDAGLERFDAHAEDAGKDVEKALASPPNTDIPGSALRPLWPPTLVNEDGETSYAHELHSTPEHRIQSNALSTRQTRHHHVEWRCTDDVDPESDEADALEAAGRGRATGNGEFVRNMKLGDVVTVWGRARFGGWQNQVYKVEIKVYWAV
jgi:hypothetical protein